MFAAGVPCAPGETGSNDQMTIEIGGRFSCTGMTGGGKTVNIQGRFNGLYRRADSCIGGGGGGGGGIVPIEQ